MNRMEWFVFLLIILVIVGIFTLFSLLAKDNKEEREGKLKVIEVEDRFTDKTTELSITTDKETGCKYIIYNAYREGGITPLMLADGTQDCD